MIEFKKTIVITCTIVSFMCLLGIGYIYSLGNSYDVEFNNDNQTNV